MVSFARAHVITVSINSHFLTECKVCLNTRLKLRAAIEWSHRTFSDFESKYNCSVSRSLERDQNSQDLYDTNIIMKAGWKIQQTDKHKRSTVIDVGSKRVTCKKVQTNSMRADWFLRRREDLPDTSSSDVLQTTPLPTLDPIFLDACARIFSTETVFQVSQRYDVNLSLSMKRIPP